VSNYADSDAIDVVHLYADCVTMGHHRNLALLMARSPISPDRRSVRTSVMLTENVHMQVQALADTHNVSSAWVIRMAIQRFLDDCQVEPESPLRLPTGQGTN